MGDLIFMNDMKYGLMLDVSRGKVLTIETLKKTCYNLKEFGYDYITLYIEDLLTLEEYPQFGYLRGKYSDDEVKELVAYCREIELNIFPSIQVLGHMEHFLRWQSSEPLMDTEQVLRVGSKDTYEFLEVLLNKCAQLFGTDYINIGMDEAFDLGHGTLLRSGNKKSPQELYLEHLDEVMKICDKIGFKKIKAWSDMLLSVYSNTDGNNLYSTDFKTEIQKVDERIELIFWNYWSVVKSHYTDVIDAHYLFSDNISIALGVHTWRLPFYNIKQLDVTKIALDAASEYPINDILFTMWGDDGSLYNLNTAFFGMYKTICLVKGIPESKEEFKRITGLEYETMEKISSYADITPSLLQIIWNDPITNIYLKTLQEDQLNHIRTKALDLFEIDDTDANVYNTYLKCVVGDITLFQSEEIDISIVDAMIVNYESLLSQLEKIWLSEAKLNGLEEIQTRLSSKIYRLRWIKENPNMDDVKKTRLEVADNVKGVKNAHAHISKATHFRW